MRQTIAFIVLVALAAPPVALAQDDGLPPPPSTTRPAAPNASAPFARLSYYDEHVKITVDPSGALHVEELAVPNDGSWDGRATPDELRQIFAAFQATDVATLKQSEAPSTTLALPREHFERGISYRPTDGSKDVTRVEWLSEKDDWKRTDSLGAVLLHVATRVAAPQAAKRHDAGRARRTWTALSVNLTKGDKPRTVKIDADGGVTILLADGWEYMNEKRSIPDADLLRLDAAIAKANVPTLPAWTSDDELAGARTSTVDIMLTERDRASRWRGSLGKAQSIARLHDLLAFVAVIGDFHQLREVARLVPWTTFDFEVRDQDGDLLRVASDRRAWLGWDHDYDGMISDVELAALNRALDRADLKSGFEHGDGDRNCGQASVRFELDTADDFRAETDKPETAKTSARTRELYRVARAILDRLKKERDAAEKAKANDAPKRDAPGAAVGAATSGAANTPGLTGALGGNRSR